MSPKKVKVALAAVVTILLLTSSYLAVLNLNEGGSGAPNVQAEPHFLDVTVTPQDAKVRPNQPVVFRAHVENAIGAIQYDWNVQDVSGGNFSDYILIENGSDASFTFNSATEDTFILTATAVDEAGGCGSAEAITFT